MIPVALSFNLVDPLDVKCFSVSESGYFLRLIRKLGEGIR